MTDQRNEFYAEQGHGLHWQCIHLEDDLEDFLQQNLNENLPNAEFIGTTPEGITCHLGDSFPETAAFSLLGMPENDVHFIALIATNQCTGENLLVSYYPECQGKKVKITLTHIYEWANGCEATLAGTLCQGEPHEIAFLDTRYALHKGFYQLGKSYTFKLAAMAFEVEEQEQTTIEFNDNDARNMYQKLGQAPERKDDGSIKPFVIHTDQLVTLFQYDSALPHIGDFQSPILNRPMTVKAFGEKFSRFQIGLNPSPEGPQNPISLYVNQNLLQSKLAKEDILTGTLWLMGYVG